MYKAFQLISYKDSKNPNLTVYVFLHIYTASISLHIAQ